jgi:hypothetical protein
MCAVTVLQSLPSSADLPAAAVDPPERIVMWRHRENGRARGECREFAPHGWTISNGATDRNGVPDECDAIAGDTLGSTERVNRAKTKQASLAARTIAPASAAER